MNKKIAFLICIVIFSIHNIQAQSKTSILNEQFENNSSSWEIVENQGEFTKIERGKYVIEVKDKEGWHWFTIEADINWNKEFLIESNIAKTNSGTENDYMGIIWGAKDNSNLFTFQINSTHQTYAVFGLMDGEWYSLINLQKSNEIRSDNKSNKLSIKKLGKDLIFLINDENVGKTFSPNPFGNKVGFFVGPSMIIEVDNLIITQNNTDNSSSKDDLNEEDIAELMGYFNSGQYEKLEDKTFEYLRIKTQTEDLDFFMGLSYMLKHNYREAAKYFESVTQNERAGYKATFPLLGQCLVNLDRFDDAIPVLDNAIKYGYGGHSFLYRGRAYLRKEKPNLENAISDFEYFIQITKNDKNPSSNELAVTYYYLGNANLEKASSLIDKDFIVAENTFVKTIDYYNQSLKYDPNSYIVYRDLGVTHMIFKQQEKAVYYYKKSLELNENQPEIKKTLNHLESNYLSHSVKLEKKGGVYHIPVELNGVLNIDFIFDSGASDVSVTPDIALTLIRTGTLKEEDWLPGAFYKFADGSVAESKRFKLSSVKVGEKVIYNVTCSISNNLDAPMLLGQSVMEKFGKYTFNYNTNELIIE